jgi:hypothetical protein
MPNDIQDRISHTVNKVVDTRISPAITLVGNKLGALGRTTTETLHAKALEDREAMARLENGVENLSIYQSTSTDIVLRNIRQSSHDMAKAVRMQSLEDRAQSLGLYRKLDQVDATIGAIRDFLRDLSSAQRNSDPDMSKSGVERAVQSILGSMWLLLSSFQLLIRELMYALNLNLCTVSMLITLECCLRHI